jgi:hypothetical protein
MLVIQAGYLLHASAKREPKQTWCDCAVYKMRVTGVSNWPSERSPRLERGKTKTRRNRARWRPVLLSKMNINAMTDVIAASHLVYDRDMESTAHQEEGRKFRVEQANQHSFVCSSCVGFAHGTLPWRSRRITAVAKMKRK